MVKYLPNGLKNLSKRIRILINGINNPEPFHRQNSSHATDLTIDDSKQQNSLKRNENKRATNYLGSSFSLKGDLIGNEDLLIDGMVEGNIEINNHSLTIGSKGWVQANIVAKNVNISGTVKGNVYAKDKVKLESASSLVGNIRSRRISIEDSARFKGSIEMEEVTQLSENKKTRIKSIK